jgi:hypothetical protein
MIRDTERLRELNRRWEREAYADLTYQEALRIYSALWQHARYLNPRLGGDWRDGLEADLAIARAVNGLSPRD